MAKLKWEYDLTNKCHHSKCGKYTIEILKGGGVQLFVYGMIGSILKRTSLAAKRVASKIDNGLKPNLHNS